MSRETAWRQFVTCGLLAQFICPIGCGNVWKYLLLKVQAGPCPAGSYLEPSGGGRSYSSEFPIVCESNSSTFSFAVRGSLLEYLWKTKIKMLSFPFTSWCVRSSSSRFGGGVGFLPKCWTFLPGYLSFLLSIVIDLCVSFQKSHFSIILDSRLELSSSWIRCKSNRSICLSCLINLIEVLLIALCLDSVFFPVLFFSICLCKKLWLLRRAVETVFSSFYSWKSAGLSARPFVWCVELI